VLERVFAGLNLGHHATQTGRGRLGRGADEAHPLEQPLAVGGAGARPLGQVGEREGVQHDPGRNRRVRREHDPGDVIPRRPEVAAACGFALRDGGGDPPPGFGVGERCGQFWGVRARPAVEEVEQFGAEARPLPARRFVGRLAGFQLPHARRGRGEFGRSHRSVADALGRHVLPRGEQLHERLHAGRFAVESRRLVGQPDVERGRRSLQPLVGRYELTGDGGELLLERRMSLLECCHRLGNRLAVLSGECVVRHAPLGERLRGAKPFRGVAPVGFAGAVGHQVRGVGRCQVGEGVRAAVVVGQFRRVRAQGRPTGGRGRVPCRQLLPESPPARQQPRPERPAGLRGVARGGG
jgi:hypothetical protein